MSYTARQQEAIVRNGMARLDTWLTVCALSARRQPERGQDAYSVMFKVCRQDTEARTASRVELSNDFPTDLS